MIRCIDCDYCQAMFFGSYVLGKQFYCKHPNQKYINQYCMEKRIAKAPGFISFAQEGTGKPRIKTSPKWCPFREKETNIEGYKK